MWKRDLQQELDDYARDVIEETMRMFPDDTYADLANRLGFRSYQTARNWCKKLRVDMPKAHSLEQLEREGDDAQD